MQKASLKLKIRCVCETQMPLAAKKTKLDILSIKVMVKGTRAPDVN